MKPGPTAYSGFKHPTRISLTTIRTDLPLTFLPFIPLLLFLILFSSLLSSHSSHSSSTNKQTNIISLFHSTEYLTMLSVASLRRSSAHIHRLTLRRLFNQAETTSTSSSSPPLPPPSLLTPASSYASDDWEFGSFLKSVSAGVVLASALGFSVLCSQPTISFADSSMVSDDDSGQQHYEEENLNKQKFLFGDSFRRKVFFNYEKRIRMRSPPEKVFEYFASFRSPEGEVFMTPADLMRAVVPVFPPSESNLVREGNLRGERGPGELRCAPSEFFILFDTNNDGLISFAEYIFFVTLLSIPESSFSVAFKMFDLDNSGEIDKDEFKKVMALMRAQNRQGAHHRDGLRIGLKVGHSVEDGGLLEYFFGKDGKSCLEHNKFVEFLRELQNEIVKLEFAHYDYKQRGTISAKDFALSMVASADMSHIKKFLRRVEDIDKEHRLKNIRITLEEFKAFAQLRRQLQPLSLAIFSYGKVNGLLTREDFKRAAFHVCGVSLTENLVDMVFHIFDVNGDGTLSTEEFVRVLQKREKDIAQPMSYTGISGLMSCWFSCAKNCSFKQAFF